MQQHNLRPLQDGESGRIHTWDSMPADARAQLLARMPPEVQAQIRSGRQISEEQVAEWMRQYYDIEHRLVLWKVCIEDETQMKRMRTIIYDAMQSARRQMERENPEARNWTDLQVMSYGLPPPKGFRWALSHERGSGPTQ